MSQARVCRPYEGLCPVSDLQFGQDALQPTGESAEGPPARHSRRNHQRQWLGCQACQSRCRQTPYSAQVQQRHRLRTAPRDCHRTATSPNDRERPPRREPHRGVTNLAVGVESGGRSYSAPAQGNILVTECCSIGRGGRIRGAGPRSRWARRPVTVASVIIAAAAAGRGRSLPRAASGVD